MDNRVRVTNVSEIGSAMELVERYAASASNDSKARVCTLVCEELLLRLLNKGCRDIYVSVKGFPSKHIEINARGARADAPDAAAEAEGDGIGVQINDCLLEQYADYFSYRYKNGVNVYSVFVEERDAIDLTDEIYDFYKNADSNKPQKPTAGHELCRLCCRRD